MRSLRNEWNRIKHAVAVAEDGTPWWEENSKEAYASGCQALANALENWSASRKGRRKGPRVGFPRFSLNPWIGPVEVFRDCFWLCPRSWAGCICWSAQLFLCFPVGPCRLVVRG